jgi:ABC-type uncharacterized transport system permease subunit
VHQIRDVIIAVAIIRTCAAQLGVELGAVLVAVSMVLHHAVPGPRLKMAGTLTLCIGVGRSTNRRSRSKVFEIENSTC